jgi:hypothetical protein
VTLLTGFLLFAFEQIQVEFLHKVHTNYTMHKFYWNNTNRGGPAMRGGPAASSEQQSNDISQTLTASQSNMDFSAVNNGGGVMHSRGRRGHHHPEVPARANGGASATIRVEQPREQRATTPSGSHRVLLKLKKMSASANRPKSVHGSFDDPAAASDVTSIASTTAPVSTSKKKSSLPSSRSMHHFYNKTWNERSLSKYASNNSHNYENVYSNESYEDDGDLQQPPNYENVLYRSMFSPEDTYTSKGLVINQLTCSPRSVRARLFQQPPPPQPEHHVPPVPPERKGRGRRRDQHQPQPQQPQISSSQRQKPLFRSKSCERPKMREAMRDTFRISSEKFTANLNRFSSNITDKLMMSNSNNNSNNSSSNSSKKSSLQPSASSSRLAFETSEYQRRESSTPSEMTTVSTNSNILQSVALRAIPCVDTQVGT